MGFSPREVDQMTLWEFNACFDAYQTAHGKAEPKKGRAMSEDRMRDLGLL